MENESLRVKLCEEVISGFSTDNCNRTRASFVGRLLNCEKVEGQEGSVPGTGPLLRDLK